MSKDSVIRTTVTKDGLLFDCPATGETIFLGIGDLTNEICRIALVHGLKQKCVDAAAMARSEKTGLSASATEKFAAVRAVVERLKGGNWTERKGAGARGDALLGELGANEDK